MNQASDGSSALELFRAHKDQIDALLLDVTLPGLSSREVLLEAQRLKPDLEVILTSAYGKETVAALFSGLKFAHFIRKPSPLMIWCVFLPSHARMIDVPTTLGDRLTLTKSSGPHH